MKIILPPAFFIALLAGVLTAAFPGCAPTVSIKYDIHRNLPIIADNSRPGKTFQAGVFHDFSSRDTVEIDYFYTSQVNQTFSAWNQSNSLLYLSYSPVGSFSVTGMMDDVGPAAELVFRPKMDDPCLALSAAGWKSDKALYFRGTAAGSHRPFRKDTSEVDDGLSGLGFFGNLSWAQYPVSIEFDQTYYDTLGTEYSWRLAGEEKGSALIAGAGLEADLGWIKAQLGISHSFAMKERGVRVDLGSQPAYLTDVRPAPVTRFLAGVIVGF
ncbi:MAG: hypothetical protein A2509_03275 [Candidatus Edwardsbacteria bacterium RIFOXYD12_FULL_50_11]|uniref:Outer membrane protein beta-barrel domain-containing protein n=1 Tax=Candidatus Edwardsbacteria bacterium GWF2_54_11 TaxID=1817851 RepID=A0A1F5RCT9_9BACT|nr:MAG: hypothetical protein A2502_03190 [Candidatus Edwardsbacteria bacterium RifOxyC12_full_54_24]OGF07720.1 MAG: hypothetical protein A2273_04440 [Candidatus Edwardsbacteria bacterium RifOxyA12_full_54_48]OGF09971.1 MAG: hypothetical protein A3K15_10850 [Candidatus Edwardsbacteria bacterium GWE2_54_12]OGF12232.1 MAG: hypothetical protein A2024_04405 [Candidatus Edwardsbacteria bacterium GWF2_54_11]OGF14880.1 MAG: hypothetical protein A2509_03275 [Candidatus Edwardsbacteria bacterium RIFOXYD1